MMRHSSVKSLQVDERRCFNAIWSDSIWYSSQKRVCMATAAACRWGNDSWNELEWMNSCFSLWNDLHSRQRKTLELETRSYVTGPFSIWSKANQRVRTKARTLQYVILFVERLKILFMAAVCTGGCGISNGILILYLDAQWLHWVFWKEGCTLWIVLNTPNCCCAWDDIGRDKTWEHVTKSVWCYADLR